MQELSVELENVQAIKHAIINFGSHGITEFIGDNSNCKSALSRVVEYLNSGDLCDKEVRENIINDFEQEARIMFSKGNEILGIILRRDRKDSMVIYSPDCTIENNPDTVIRYLEDSGYLQLVYKFGFRSYQKGEICLQVCPTYGAIPFVTTKGKTNMEIINDITSDKVAEEFLENYEKITDPAFRSRLKTLRTQEASLVTMISACKLYDYNRYKELSVQMGEVIVAIGQYSYFEIGDIPIPPIVDIVEVPNYQISDIPLPAIGPIKSPIADLSQLIVDYDNAMNRICPTCLRRFTEHDEYAVCECKNEGT